MNPSPPELPDEGYIVRIVAALLGGFFFLVALIVGSKSLHAHAAQMPLPTVRGGAMRSREAFRIAGLSFAVASLCGWASIRAGSVLAICRSIFPKKSAWPE
jgi:hypothetical protein